MHPPEPDPNRDADKIALQSVERQATVDESLKGEFIEDEGEVFKSHTGHAEFRALGWYVP